MATERPTSANSLSLYELNAHVRGLIETQLDEPVWLRAELSEARENRGHCYVEFIQKADDGNSILARARGQVWANTWALLRPHFERATGQRLSAGMQVLVKVRPTFHEVYGYSLNVVDIDPTYTLGDLARRRQEILRTLEQQGVLHMNQELPLPRLLQRIAVVSAASAAGYQDFCNQLSDNTHGLAFHTQLFPAVMQGDQVEPSVIRALDTIAAQSDHWDCVVIIRGGGAAADLNGFDTLALAENVAQFPLPIITGIGHERDDTVIDLVSHTRVKTPTAAAEFLIQHQLGELHTLNDLAERLTRRATERLLAEQLRFERLAQQLPTLFALRSAREQQRMQLLLQRAQHAAATLLTHQQHRLALAKAKLKAAQPEHILRLGFSITRADGHALTDASQVAAGTTLTTTLLHGTLTSTTLNP
jgi:exodeoxyribonuclease VII large subunit